MKNAIITNIQHFSVGDGPGIRTTVFFKGCNLHCPWCHNPETISADIHPMYGRIYTVDAVMEEIMEDVEFYSASGGGVTLSGGEPLLQTEVCGILARECKKQGLHVLLDTAGNVDFSLFEKMLSYIDMCYFDLKSGTEEGYRVVGGQLKRTLRNMQEVADAGVTVTVRIPVIPGYNDDFNSAEQMAEILKDIKVKQVDLLPFHRLGSNKYTALGMDYQYKDIPAMTSEQIEPLTEVFQKHGFIAVVGG